MEHSDWTPSGATRWMNCPASVNFCKSIPEPPSSVYAEWGTDCHALAEAMALSAYHGPSKKYPDLEMVEVAKGFVDYCNSLECDKAKVEVLARHPHLTEIFGTVDFAGVKGKHLHIADLKTGKGVPVSAEGNKQLMIYAIMVMGNNWMRYSGVTLHIYQPRIDNVSCWPVSPVHLHEWDLNTLQPAYRRTLAGDPEFNPSADTCRWCRGKGVCEAYANINLEIAQADFAPFIPPAPGQLSDEQLVAIITYAKDIESWLKSVKEYVKTLDRLPVGLKMVEGRKTRKWRDKAAVEKWLRGKTLRKEVIESKLRTPAQVEKLLKGTKYHKQLAEFIEIKPGPLTVVPESDKRNAVTDVELDFKPYIKE